MEGGAGAAKPGDWRQRLQSPGDAERSKVQLCCRLVLARHLLVPALKWETPFFVQVGPLLFHCQISVVMIFMGDLCVARYKIFQDRDRAVSKISTGSDVKYACSRRIANSLNMILHFVCFITRLFRRSGISSAAHLWPTTSLWLYSIPTRHTVSLHARFLSKPLEMFVQT